MLNASSETRKKLSRATKASWADPEYRVKRAEAHKRPASLSKMRAVAKSNWENPEYRARHTAVMKAKWADPKFRAAQSQKIRRALRLKRENS